MAEALADYLDANPIRQWRAGQGHSIHDLATMLGVTRAMVRAWESGQHMPDPIHLAELRELTGDSDIGASLIAWRAKRPRGGGHQN